MKITLSVVALPLDLVYNALHFITLNILKCCLPKAVFVKIFYSTADDVVLFHGNDQRRPYSRIMDLAKSDAGPNATGLNVNGDGEIILSEVAPEEPSKKDALHSMMRASSAFHRPPGEVYDTRGSDLGLRARRILHRETPLSDVDENDGRNDEVLSAGNWSETPSPTTKLL